MFITSSEYNVSGIVIIMTGFYAQLAGLVYEYGYWRRCGSMLEQSWWLRSIDIISGRNSIQATSNHKYADKDKYKWAINMYEHLTVDLFNLHPPMALNVNSFGFHMASRKYIPSYANFHDRMEQFHDATWVGVNSDWMSQLLYEWQKFMNSICPFLFNNPWCSCIFQQPWKVSNNFSMVNVYTTYPWMCIYHCSIHIRDHCKWSQDISSHII